MNDGAVIVAVVGVGVGMLAVLVPLLLPLGRRISDVAADIAEVRRNLHAEATTIRAVVRALAERVARIEGAMNPWRPPANGAPAPSGTPPPEATA